MYCRHCGNQIDNDSKFCSSCGKTNQTDASPEIKSLGQPIQQNIPYQQNRPVQDDKQDLGLVLIALFSIFHIIVWQLYTKLNENWYDNKVVVHTLEFLFIIQWIIMLVFAKKVSSKIIIAICGLAILGYNIYLVIERN
jgi:uncharacterized membrane protein YvbJ